MVAGQPEQDPFKVCRLPLGAYQQATFVNLPDNTGYSDQFGNEYQLWTPPVYTVTVRSAEEGFQVREARLVLDATAIDKLVIACRAAAHPTDDNLASLEVLMATQEYGEFRR